MALGLDMSHWGCGTDQVCTNDESGLTLTFFTTGLKFIPNEFILKHLKMLIFLHLFKRKS